MILINLHLCDIFCFKIFGHHTVTVTHQIQPLDIEFADITTVMENSPRLSDRQFRNFCEQVRKSLFAAIGKNTRIIR